MTYCFKKRKVSSVYKRKVGRVLEVGQCGIQEEN